MKTTTNAMHLREGSNIACMACGCDYLVIERLVYVNIMRCSKTRQSISYVSLLGRSN